MDIYVIDLSRLEPGSYAVNECGDERVPMRISKDNPDFHSSPIGRVTPRPRQFNTGGTQPAAPCLPSASPQRLEAQHD